MKFLVVLACFIALGNTVSKDFKEKFMEKVQEYGTKCIAEVHASNDDIAALMSHNIPTSHEGKCMVLCMHRSFNTISEDGTPNKEGTVESLAPLKEADPETYEKMMQLFETCTTSLVKDDDPCITAANWAACGLKEAKAIGMEDMFDM